MRAGRVGRRRRTRGVAWAEALQVASERLAAIKRSDGPASIGVIGGARLSNEDAYAWAKLAKGVIGTDSVDAQLGDGLPAELVLGLPRATIDETCSAGCVVVLAGDLREELPVLYLRLRAAAEETGLTDHRDARRKTTHVSSFARRRCRQLPGEAAALALALVSSSKDAKGRPESVTGRRLARAPQRSKGRCGRLGTRGRARPASVAESETFTAEAAAAIAGAYPARGSCRRCGAATCRARSTWASRPGLLPGRVSLESAKDWYGSQAGGRLSRRNAVATRPRSSRRWRTGR